MHRCFSLPLIRVPTLLLQPTHHTLAGCPILIVLEIGAEASECRYALMILLSIPFKVNRIYEDTWRPGHFVT